MQTYLAIQVEEIKRKETNSDFDVLHFHILTFALTELLEGQKFSLPANCYRFRIKHKRFCALFDALTER